MLKAFFVCVGLGAGFSTASAQVTLFGNSVDLGGSSNHASNFLLGSAISVTTSGPLADAGIIFRSTGYQGQVALYDSTSGGLPGQLLATTGTFTVSTVGPVLIPFTTTPVLSTGTYWFMAVFSANASVGFSNAGSQLVAYNSFSFGSSLPTTFGTPITYTGQAFNYYLQLKSIPEPATLSLQILGLLVLSAHFVGRQQRISYFRGDRRHPADRPRR